MAWRSEAAVALTLAVGLGAIGPRAAMAEPACGRAPTISLMTMRQGLAPPRADRLGIDLLVRSVELGWGGGCQQRRHHVEVSELEAPSYGAAGRSVIRLGAYRRSWSGAGWTLHLGLRAASRWGDAWRFVTPIVGGSLRRGALGLAAELDVGGLSLLAGDVVTSARSDLVFEGRAAWPDQAAIRGELRLRARDLGMPGGLDVRDVTVSAGLGLALAAREDGRALPGFVGLAARLGDDAAGLVVVEWAMGVGPR